MIHHAHRQPRSSDFLSLTLASGGDRRIVMERGGNTNPYGASPFPRSTLGYAASTANDISAAAFTHLAALVETAPVGSMLEPAVYRDTLEQHRGRIRALFGLPGAVDIVFAPSGTDLEYVALAIAAARSGRPVTNILLGQDEVGSGCILSAGGRYFANETALTGNVRKGDPAPGLGDSEVIALNIREIDGSPADPGGVCRAIAATALDAAARGRSPLVHVLHGSKTGLVLPSLPEIDAIARRLAGNVAFVVDACQMRLAADDIRAYLARGAIVMLTGSKFAGGPPFSGFALVPPGLRPRGGVAPGLATIFRRAEWPMDWVGCDHMPVGSNPGLLLRIEAALFEMERFALVPEDARNRVTAAFCAAVTMLADGLGAEFVTALEPSGGLHRSTLATLDLSGLPGRPDHAMARRWHRVLAARGLRLGQPVKCLRWPDGTWKGNLRVSLSMPLIVELASLDRQALSARLHHDMACIAQVIEAAQRPVVA